MTPESKHPDEVAAVAARLQNHYKMNPDFVDEISMSPALVQISLDGRRNMITVLIGKAQFDRKTRIEGDAELEDGGNLVEWYVPETVSYRARLLDDHVQETLRTTGPNRAPFDVSNRFIRTKGTVTDDDLTFPKANVHTFVMTTGGFADLIEQQSTQKLGEDIASFFDHVQTDSQVWLDAA